MYDSRREDLRRRQIVATEQQEQNRCQRSKSGHGTTEQQLQQLRMFVFTQRSQTAPRSLSPNRIAATILAFIMAYRVLSDAILAAAGDGPCCRLSYPVSVVWRLRAPPRHLTGTGKVQKPHGTSRGTLLLWLCVKKLHLTKRYCALVSHYGSGRRLEIRVRLCDQEIRSDLRPG